MRCPGCGVVFDPLEGLMENDWLEIIRLLPVFGNQGRLVFEYVEKFGVMPLRMKGKKVLRLLQDVSKYVEHCEFAFHKVRYKISRHGVFEALKVLNNKHFERSLENHNYLKKVMMTISGREEKELRGVAEKELRRKEKRIMTNAECRMPNAEVRKEEGGETMTAQEYLASVGKKSFLGKME